MKDSVYIFESKRLGFRAWLDSDIPAMTAISADPEVMQYFPGTYDLAHTKRFIGEMQVHFKEHGYCYYAVDELASGEFIGFIGLKWITMNFEPSSFTDIGWRLKRSCWGKGYATEGATRCLEFGHEKLGLHRIYAIAPAVNLPSIHVMKKAGMKFNQEFDHPLLLDNERLRICVLYFKEAK